MGNPNVILCYVGRNVGFTGSKCSDEAVCDKGSVDVIKDYLEVICL